MARWSERDRPASTHHFLFYAESLRSTWTDKHGCHSIADINKVEPCGRSTSNRIGCGAEIDRSSNSHFRQAAALDLLQASFGAAQIGDRRTRPRNRCRRWRWWRRRIWRWGRRRWRWRRMFTTTSSSTIIPTRRIWRWGWWRPPWWQVGNDNSIASGRCRPANLFGRHDNSITRCGIRHGIIKLSDSRGVHPTAAN